MQPPNHFIFSADTIIAGLVMLIVVVLFDGYEPLDVAGPVNLFGYVDENRFVYVSENGDKPVLSKTAVMAMMPQISFDQFLSEKKEDGAVMLLVPGGIGAWTEVQNEKLLDFLREMRKRSEVVFSVCTGAALFAAAGLLDGKKATSNKRSFDWVKTSSSNAINNVMWIERARWVQDGDTWTSSGVQAGMDAAYAIIKALNGEDVAKTCANIIEYVPHEDPSWDPFSRSKEP
eukprot:TRINITY_DN179_c0_g1_i1.p1 TRINITY_DN179_c0_g1~~TRINITY_DN179_c0_g1_i1.p1  ORF type:complete len:231 (-),score=71.08 TRINITY_DN179_c0_g1_i1:127-819(-)